MKCLVDQAKIPSDATSNRESIQSKIPKVTATDRSTMRLVDQPNLPKGDTASPSVESVAPRQGKK